MKKIAYVVQSGNRSKWLWPTWEYFFKKHWDTGCGIDVVWIGETELPAFRNVHYAFSGEGPWGYTVKAALSHLDYEYVIFTHEDYIFTGVPNYERIFRLTNIMDERNIDLIKICGWWSGHISVNFPMVKTDIEVHPGENLWKYHNQSLYLTSQQPSIWNKEFLISTIADNDTPWGHEMEGTTRLAGRQPNASIYSYRGPEQPIPYDEISTQGGPRPGAEHRFAEAASI